MRRLRLNECKFTAQDSWGIRKNLGICQASFPLCDPDGLWLKTNASSIRRRQAHPNGKDVRACIALIFPAEEDRGAPTACFSKEPCVSSSSLVRFSRFRFLMDQPANVRRWAMGGSETSSLQEIWRDNFGEAAEPKCTPKTANSLPTGGGATVDKAIGCVNI